jgi:hypothetical protein
MGRALAKPIIFSREKLMGFASLYPSYALSQFSLRKSACYDGPSRQAAMPAKQNGLAQ